MLLSGRRAKRSGGILPPFLLSLLLGFAFLQCGRAAPEKVLPNSESVGIPTLSVSESERIKQPLISATFPGLPDQVFDSWCFEGPWVQFLSSRELDGGRLELRHRYNLEPPVLIITTVTPEPGGVEFLAKAEPHPDAGGKFPDTVRAPNICWQVRRAPMFSSLPDSYDKFHTRCFFVTKRGLTFLNKTKRNPDQRKPFDDPQNTPPWIQRYLRSGVPEREGVAMNTTDRFTIPIIGIVSRDKQYIAAIVNNSASMMTQMWHDCLHNNPEWLPDSSPPSERTWRYKYYVMKNDFDTLLARVAKDFPDQSKGKAGP